VAGEGTSPATAARFDQRPGELEATRGLRRERSGLMVCGSRGGVSAGWSVLAVATGEHAGECCQVVLSVEDARAAARELNEMCDLLEGRIW
jgi:hypothetical protein